MKKSVILTLGLALLPWVTTLAQVDDDLYYVPSKSKKSTTATTTVESTSTTTTVRPVTEPVSTGYSIAPATIVVRDRQGNTRDVDEYNRRYSSNQNNFSVENDTLYIDERIDSDLNGEWVNGFDGSQDDYEYAVRLIRFRNPRYAIPVSSPLYWDIVYGGLYPTWDWNVYDDGLYAYVFPTYTNRLWWNWRYGPVSSWYGGWYAGWNSWYGWGWDPWYRDIWARPYYSHVHFGGFHGGVHAPAVSRPIGGNRPAVAHGSGHFTGTRVGVNGVRQNVNGMGSGSRFNGVNGGRSAYGVSNGNNSSVRPSSGALGTRSNGTVENGSRSTRSTSSYVRPSSSRGTGNTYNRPSSTRSNSSASQGSSSRSQSGSSYRSSGSNSGSFSGGSHSSGSTGGGSRGGGGGSHGGRR